MVHSNNMPCSMENMRTKPFFFGPKLVVLIKASQPMERFSVDFKSGLQQLKHTPKPGRTVRISHFV